MICSFFHSVSTQPCLSAPLLMQIFCETLINMLRLQQEGNSWPATDRRIILAARQQTPDSKMTKKAHDSGDTTAPAQAPSLQQILVALVSGATGRMA